MLVTQSCEVSSPQTSQLRQTTKPIFALSASLALVAWRNSPLSFDCSHIHNVGYTIAKTVTSQLHAD